MASIFAGTNGYIDKIGTADVTRYEAAMLSYLRSDHADILGTIRDSRDFSDDTKAKLKSALDSFARTLA